MKFLVLCAAVCCVLADNHERMGMGMGAMGGAEPCCLPDQWVTKIATTSGYKQGDEHGEMRTWTEMATDFAAGKLVGHETAWTDEGEKNYTYIADFRKKYMKYIDHSTKSCVWFDLPGPLVGQCLTKKAKFQGITRVGMGESSIATENWDASFSEGNVNIGMNLGVTEEHCVPVYSKVYGEMDDLEFVTSSMFFDNKDMIADNKIFDVPEICEEATKIETPDTVKARIFLESKFSPSTSPHKCCFPMAWEGQMSQITGMTTPGGQSSSMSVFIPHVAVDYENLKFACSEYVMVNGISTQNVTFIGDMRYGVMYSMDIDTKECKKYNIPTVGKMAGQCVPASAKFIGSPTLGLKDGGLETSVWRIHYDSPQVNMTVDMSVTQAGGVCVPVGELAMGEGADGSGFLTNTGFFDLTGGIQDEDVFHPPESCNGAPVENLPADVQALIDGMLKRFANE